MQIYKFYRGSTILSILLLLNGLLVLFLLLDQDVLNVHHFSSQQRLKHLSAQTSIQRKIGVEKTAACQKITNAQLQFMEIIYYSDNKHVQNTIQCERNVLLKTTLQQAINIGINDFIYRSNKEWFITTQNDLSIPLLHWVETGKIMELSEDFHGLIILEKGATLAGSGRIFGALISDDKISHSIRSRVIFDIQPLNELLQQQNKWRYAQQSWRDF